MLYFYTNILIWLKHFILFVINRAVDHISGSPKKVQEEVIAKQNGLPEVESAVDGFPEPPISQEPDISSLDGEKWV